MNNFTKNIALWVIIGILLITLFNLFDNSAKKNSIKEVPFSDFIAEVDAGNVNSVNIRGINVEGFFENGLAFSTYAPNYPELVDKLNTSGVKIPAEPTERGRHQI